ncbi:hypothetical protein ORV05_23545 [Amycolatopsis cynarae]|uniref:Cupin domain-containing protein n=1 Tax=Amycolatopsis cynarae TaxID=2995223 RepID=A0ABY7AZD3_9PSEU|nr:hypothetical protein [Amycolatopsis sp. HUAS 11-8]WAL63953.1 hypothetical protein ORV05_23545 [Amycolatopsis sp. HUAS 11-8]
MTRIQGHVPHHAVVNLTALAAELLEEARKHPARRTARTVAASTSQRATLIVALDGAELAEHDAPAAATLHVLSGRVRLRTADHEWDIEEGELFPVPPERHGVVALADAVFLLTVALR